MTSDEAIGRAIEFFNYAEASYQADDDDSVTIAAAQIGHGYATLAIALQAQERADVVGG